MMVLGNHLKWPHFGWAPEGRGGEEDMAESARAAEPVKV